jgi:NAD(P)-dependent dehydrogenase (short-subunit alcohol dehydrogenase family)
MQAVVVGGSRGLGAALARVLAMEGADVVVTYALSTDAANALVAECADTPGRVRALQLDAANPESAHQLREEIESSGRGVDLLVLNAAPALRPMPLDDAFTGRIIGYVTESFAMVSGPLLALLPSVRITGGQVVGISSEFVETSPPEWSHYVSAKTALEGLLQTLAVAEPSVRVAVARPPRLQTDLTRSPLGHRSALSPAEVAVRLAEFLRDGAESGRVHVFPPASFTPSRSSTT